eukprot:CFRG3795T1
MQDNMDNMNITADEEEGVGLLCMPFDVIHGICVHLDPEDVCELSKTCRTFRRISQTDSVWMSMAKAHFTHWRCPTTTAQTFPFNAHAVVCSDGWESVNANNLSGQELYKQMQRPTRVQYVDEMDVAWSEDRRYYEYMDRAGSISSRVLRLKHVCYLWAKAVFPSVRPGYYQPIWRIQTTSDIRIHEPVVVEAHPDSMNELSYYEVVRGVIPPDEQSTTVRRVEKELSSIPRGVWYELKLPVIQVHRTSDICTLFKNSTGTWKRGIVFDCVRLVKMHGDGTLIGSDRGERNTSNKAQTSSENQTLPVSILSCMDMYCIGTASTFILVNPFRHCSTRKESPLTMELTITE